MRSVVVALGGPSASGKTTLVRTLVARYGWAPLDEAFYRLRPRPALRIGSQPGLAALERRLLREEARRFREASALADQGRTVVADTGFLDPVSYTAGLLLLGLASPATFEGVVRAAQELARRGELGIPDLTVRLSVPRTARRVRAARDPGGHPRAFRSRHEAVGEVESAVVVPAFAHAHPGSVQVVRAVDPAERLATRVHALVGRVRPLPDPCAAASRALAAVLRRPEVRVALGRAGNLKKGTPSPRPPR